MDLLLRESEEESAQMELEADSTKAGYNRMRVCMQQNSMQRLRIGFRSGRNISVDLSNRIMK